MEPFFKACTMENDLLQHCFLSGGLHFITPLKAYKLLKEGLLLVDLRPDFERACKTPAVPNLLPISYTEIENLYDQISKDQYVILADAVGLRSKEVLISLIEKGYTNAVSLAGGIVDWERDGLPMLEDLNERMSGSCMCQIRPREIGKHPKT